MCNQLRKVQFIQLDILKQVIALCEKHDITYFAAYGTLLGAVRHKGFIPWDDDIDLMMPRPDYDRFCEIAQTELKKPFFLQTMETDSGYLFSIAKVHNLNTAFIQKKQIKARLKSGIFIDVWPLDGWEETRYCKHKYSFYKRFYKYYRYCPGMDTGDIIKFLLCKVFNAVFFGNKSRKFFRNKMSGTIAYDDAEFVSIRPSNTKALYEKNWCKEAVNGMFENTPIKLPIGYDAVLRADYGDYMQLPPENERSPHHENLVIDTERSYTDYM